MFAEYSFGQLYYWSGVYIFFLTAILFTYLKLDDNQKKWESGIRTKVMIIYVIPILLVFYTLGYLFEYYSKAIIKFIYPILYAIICLTVVYNLLSIIFEYIVPIEFITLTKIYIAFTVSCIFYAHFPLNKKIYIFLLSKLGKMLNIGEVQKLIELEKLKVNNKLLSLHIYILLFITYFGLAIWYTDTPTDTKELCFINPVCLFNQIGLVKEAFVTYVIFDTIYNYRKELRKLKVI